MSPTEEKLLWKTQVSISVENTLREIGKFEFKKILDMLKENYNVSLSDCYDNPEFLKKILKDLFGNSYESIIAILEKNLDGLVLLEPIKEFLTIMKN
ncbi:MAG: hypothetical protein FJ356_00310 [Thaumarchaeota archaeon]|nr:hypothetical protein [Nitrososphaerota archaeon]